MFWNKPDGDKDMEKQDLSLRDINLQLKGSDTENEQDSTDQEQGSTINRPKMQRPFIKAQFYEAVEGGESNFMFIASLNEMPRYGETFSIEGENYQVLGTTRQLFLNPNKTFAKEIAVKILVGPKRTWQQKRPYNRSNTRENTYEPVRYANNRNSV